jgi:tetratricopeptide (TPR) repeat protein
MITAVRLFAEDAIVKADSLFEYRNEGFNQEELLADSTNINNAIDLYKQVLTDSVNSEKKHEAIWKLLRAHYFKGNYITKDNDYKKLIFAQGMEIGEKFLPEFPESVEIHCWLGILWGYLGEVYSGLSAARMGIPKKVKYYAQKVIELNDTYLDGGGYRMLGRLHFLVPKIPIFMNWPSKKKSQLYLEKAHEIAPDNMLNKLYLAEVLFRRDQEERARILLQEILDTEGVVHGLAVDTWIKSEAKDLMKKYMDD